MKVASRVIAPVVALETTLLLHGVPKEASLQMARDLASDVMAGGAKPALVGVVAGDAIAGLRDEELNVLLAAAKVPKANTSNLGVLLARKSHAATTVSTTMEIAAAAGIRVFATGGLGGVHQGWTQHLDVSADLMAFTRFPVALLRPLGHLSGEGGTLGQLPRHFRPRGSRFTSARVAVASLHHARACVSVHMLSAPFLKHFDAFHPIRPLCANLFGPQLRTMPRDPISRHRLA